MADSKRKRIMDAVLSALANVTSLVYVSERLVHWEELDASKFPACFPIDADEVKEPHVLFESADEDMLSKLTLILTCYCYDAQGATRQQRTDLIKNIEAEFSLRASALNALVLTITATRVVTDKGALDNYSVFDCEYEIQYLYDHTDP